MLNNIVAENVIPFKYVLGDTIYGSSPDFIEAVESCVGVTYFVEAASDTKCWLQRPITRGKQYRYKGEIRTNTVLEKTDYLQYPGREH